MLIEFSVENFRSFKEMVTLSMVASPDTSLEQNVIKSAQGSKFHLLKSAAIYGANASGKTNLLLAIDVMREFVLTSAQESLKSKLTPYQPFKLSADCLSRQTTFEIAFLDKGIKYLYGFSLDKTKIVNEWLYTYPKGRKRVLFERDEYTEDETDIIQYYHFGDHWKGESKRLAAMTRYNTLFISVAAQFNHPTAGVVVHWFSEKLLEINPHLKLDPENIFAITLIALQAGQKDLVLAMLKEADLSIEDLNIPEKIIMENVEEKNMPLTIEQVLTTHHRTGQARETEPVEFKLTEESSGTQTYFSIIGPTIAAIAGPRCLILDELDLHLHPILTKRIVEVFHSDFGRDAQFIFTTHDVTLLESKDLLRRDQIWFTAKTEEGASDLYSAWDYKVRKGENLGKGYLAGRYGAIPYIEKLLPEPSHIHE